MYKRISVPATDALADALTCVYWYKRDLKRFLVSVVKRPELLAQVNWDDYKRNIASSLVGCLARNQDVYQQELLDLMSDISDMTDFSHLRRLEEGEAKARAAEQAVFALRKMFESHRSVDQERKTVERRRMETSERLRQQQAVSARLERIRSEYMELFKAEQHARGYALEKIMRELFELFDLDPKSSFRVTGEQIDGGFSFEATDYLFEAKWCKGAIAAAELDSFSSKIGRKLDNTLGLFLSLSGFSEDGIEAHSRGRLRLLLMDGADLMAVLEKRIELPDLLLRKRRHASQTGEIFISAATLIYS